MPESIPPYYSTEQSKQFCRRVKRTNNAFTLDMAIILQNTETQVLASLAAAERLAQLRKPHRSRPRRSALSRT